MLTHTPSPQGEGFFILHFLQNKVVYFAIFAKIDAVILRLVIFILKFKYVIIKLVIKWKLKSVQSVV